MSLEAVSDRLRELAEAESGLRRSRAMAQLWAEIRTSSPEERRAFGHALADRFAPELAERFESITGIEGPEFIELVRNLIDLEADDIRSVLSDLADLADDPTSLADGSGASARDGDVEEVFDRLSKAADDASDDPVSDAAERLLAGDVDSEALAHAVEALDDLPGAEATPTAFEEAQERLRRLDESEDREDAADGSPEPVSPVPHGIEHPPAVVDGERATDEQFDDRSDEEGTHDGGESTESGELADRLRAVPDGWRRRRMLSAVIRRDEVDVATALELRGLLSNRIDRSWIAGDLIERGLTDEERALMRTADLPAHLARRLERTS